MLCATRIRVVSDGGPATVVVVVDAGTVVVVAAVVFVVAGTGAAVVDETAARDDAVLVLPVQLAMTTPASARRHPATTRAPGREPARLGLIERT
jgi:hypothetical protein